MNLDKLTLDNLNMQFCSDYLKEQIHQILEENATLRHEFKMLQAGSDRQSQENKKMVALLLRCQNLMHEDESSDNLWIEIDTLLEPHR